MLMFNITVNTEEGEENETFVKESTIQAVDKTNIETEMLNDSSPELSLSLPVSPPLEPEIAFVAEQTTGSSIPVDKPFESLSTMSLKCTDQKPEVERVDANRKLFVVRATDIRRSRSADIFRSDNVAATFCPATVRAQSETRDVTVKDSWNALSATHQTLAVENLTAPVRAVELSAFQRLVFRVVSSEIPSGKFPEIYSIFAEIC